MTADPSPSAPSPEFYSCFLSYAHKESEFADKLYTDLTAHGIECWKDTDAMKGGGFYRAQISLAIARNAKLILVCSSTSLEREGVFEEINAAMIRERETHTQKLFPIRLDEFIFSSAILTLADAKMAAGQWPEDWVRYVRQYHIPDFSNWGDEAAYEREFNKLLRDLTQPASR